MSLAVWSTCSSYPASLRDAFDIGQLRFDYIRLKPASVVYI